MSELQTSPTQASTGMEERLPFDVRTVLIGVWNWRYILVCWSLLCAVASVVIAIGFAPRAWQSEAVVLHQPPSNELLAGMYNPPSIHTQLNMVKVKPNLAETRRRLGLDCTLDRLGACCDIVNPRDSQLLIFRVEWDTSEGCAAISNMLSELFIEQQRELRVREMQSVISDLKARIETLQTRIADAEALSVGGDRQRLERELLSCRNRLDAADEMYEKALTEQKAVKRQLSDVDQMMEDVKQELTQKQSVSAKTETMSSLNIRVERIREKILDDRIRRMHDVRAKQWEERLRFSQRMLAQGFLTEKAYQQELLEWEHFKAKAEDTSRMEALKKELEDLYSQMRPTNPNSVDSNPLVQGLMIQRYNLLLEEAAADERVTQIAASRKRLEQEYAELLANQPVSKATDRPLTQGWRIERDQLEETLAKLQALQESGASDLTYISHAEAPSLPSRSMRRPFAIVLTLAGTLLGCVAVTAGQILNTSLRSRAEVQLRLGRPILGVIPDVRTLADASMGNTDESLLEPIRAIARRIRAAVPLPHARILLVSAGEDEGKTTVSTQLATCLGQQGEQVLLLDANLRAQPEADGMKDMLLSDDDQPAGWGDYLAENVQKMAQVVYPSVSYGVHCVPRASTPVVPELLGSSRLEESFRSLPEPWDILLIDGPPASHHADAEILAEHVDGVIVVIQSGRFSAAAINDVITRLEATRTPLLGVILNKVPTQYFSRSC